MAPLRVTRTVKFIRKAKKFTITKLEVLEGCRKELLNNLRVGIYTFQQPDDFELYGKNISVAAIVGMNGAGKSSLLELMFRIINNFNYYLIGNRGRCRITEGLSLIDGVYATLEYKIGEETGLLICKGRGVGLDFGGVKYQLSKDPVFSPEDGDVINAQSTRNDTCIDITRNFFYTIVTNYSLQAYNVNDYIGEAEDRDPILNGNEVGQGNWLNGLFHKNDGYMTSICLNPYRNNGVFDLQSETNLTKTRLSGLLVEAKNKNKSLIREYNLSNIEYHFDRIYVAKKFSQSEDLDWVELYNSFLGLRSVHTSVIRTILDAYKIPLHLNGPDCIDGANMYLVCKTLNIADTYPPYRVFEIADPYAWITKHDLTKEQIMNLKELVKTILSDKSHITTKVHQTLNFLKAYDHAVKDTGIPDVLKSGTFTYYGFYASFMAPIKRKTSGLEELLTLMPPPFFKSTILLEKFDDQAIVPFNRLSSGERQFLFMISTLVYHIINIKSVPTTRIHYRNFNLVLDEVEICFHPEYQRQFVYNLTQIIKFLRLNIYCSFNIFLTTHSPFILSDITKNNVLYLKDGAPIKRRANPFAANVNDILADSFFLKNGFMGEFVQRTLLNLIRDLKDQKPENNDGKTNEHIISLVGDPLLKIHLKSLLNQIENEENKDR